MTRDSLVIRRRSYEPIKDLSAEDKGILLDAICNYSFNEINPEGLTPSLLMAFKYISGAIDWDNEKYKTVVERNRKNGKKGGRPLKNPKEPKKPNGLINNPKNPKEPKKPEYEYEYDSDSDSGIKKKKTNVFIRPSFVEIEQCFNSKIKEEALLLNSTQQAKQFEAYYESIGWMVGKKKMTKWKSAISGWVYRTAENNGSVKNHSHGKAVNNYEQSNERAL